MTIVVCDLGGVAARFHPERRSAALAAGTGQEVVEPNVEVLATSGGA